MEVLAHRIFWSAAWGAALAAVLGIAWWRVLRDRRTVAVLLIASVMVAINWGLFIWAINNGRGVDGALAYYINPLLSVLAGVVLLREKLSAMRWVAVGVAALGLIWMTIDVGQLPWIPLVMAAAFATYGVIKKRVQVDAVSSMTVESLLLSPVAVGYAVFLAGTGTGSFWTGGWVLTVLLVVTGVVSLAPLLLFTFAAQRITLFALGMLQYIAPTLILLLSLLVLGETMTPGRLVGFILVWSALLLITVEGIHLNRRRRRNTGTIGTVEQATTSPEE